jgi:hypothetical protein
MWLIEIDETGTLCRSGFPGESMDHELLRGLLSTETIREIPLPTDGDENYIAYAAWDVEGRRPSIFVDRFGEPIYGALVVAGLDGDGNARFLAEREMDRFSLQEKGKGGLPLLVYDVTG